MEIQWIIEINGFLQKVKIENFSEFFFFVHFSFKQLLFISYYLLIIFTLSVKDSTASHAISFHCPNNKISGHSTLSSAILQINTNFYRNKGEAFSFSHYKEQDGTVDVREHVLSTSGLTHFSLDYTKPSQVVNKANPRIVNGPRFRFLQ